jgi:hypothetical protein
MLRCADMNDNDEKRTNRSPAVQFPNPRGPIEFLRYG